MVISIRYEKNKSTKRKKSVLILTVTATVFLIAGLALLLYPHISNKIGTIKAEKIIKDFDEKVNNVIDISFEQALEEKIVDEDGYTIDESGNRTSETQSIFKADIDRLYADSLEYNKSLINNQGTVDTSDYTTAALDMSNYGIYDNIYCYISAPSINMRLPVYLGANEYNMSCGAAHLCNTSLPLSIGDINVAIAAHTGYIGRIFFDNITQLNIGDEVSIKNYFETIDYKVTDKKIVNEHYTKDLFINSGKKQLTLITCISNNNGGFDRYIVICEKA